MWKGCVRLACRGRWPGPIGDLLKPGIDECGAQEVAQRQDGVARPPIVGGRCFPRNWLDALLPHGCTQCWQGLLGVPREPDRASSFSSYSPHVNLIR